MQNAAKTLQFFSVIGQLKKLKRTGWVRRDIQEPETVSGHMYRMAIMAMLLNKNNNSLNTDHCVKLALVHDMAECIVGDITPHDNVTDEDKHTREKRAMESLKQLVDPVIGQELYDLWEEYENQVTEESKAVKDLDKFDMILQAFEYEKQHQDRGPFLQEFFDSTHGKFQTPSVCEWVQELYKQRGQSGAGGEKKE